MSNNKFNIFTKPFSVVTYSPMVRLSIDFVDPINADEDSGYILVIIDTFSKWVELYPCKNATAKLLQSASSSTLVATEHHLRYCLTMAVTL